ncbi:MAG: radical SAM protein [Bacteroidota bacterium]
MRLIARPVLCNYYVTYRCNATCSFCDIWEKPSPYVTLENAAENLKALKALGVKVIDFTGGEPLLHREMDKLLALAKSMGFITTLTTNTLLYPKRAQSLRGLVDMLHFSLDSPIEAEHNKSRGVNCFGSFTESIKVAKSLGERPDIIFTVFSHNLHQIDQVWREICLPNNLVLILNPAFDYGDIKTGEGLNAAALQSLNAWAGKKNVYLNQAFISLRQDGGNHIAKPICKAASSTIVISPENKLVLPCYHLGLQDFEIKGDLYNLWKSEPVQKLVSLEGKYEQCEGCVINCYMQPSFAVEMNKYWWQALPSTIKYNRVKGTWRQMLRF